MGEKRIVNIAVIYEIDQSDGTTFVAMELIEGVKLRAQLIKLIKRIRRVHQTDPLRCDCGGTYRVIAFITEPITYCS